MTIETTTILLHCDHNLHLRVHPNAPETESIFEQKITPFLDPRSKISTHTVLA